ncbi:UdgX family uracil-DNA binding protein [Novosphingobium sp. BW1]|uniref:UdgX family uracil-DNA binding protein n=1 Tax=Novosphingobium sp. BW1 TaxID=2592621 RepID=UPI0011DEF1B7|nr:UdgX family uracil-DNA binding protein [Novosphingobium sp. BW1]TYC91685.1 UdgX family uracil-DNA binding protein [Novosphingobium sp. BW1]
MIVATLQEPDDFEAWRDEARRLVSQGHAPHEVSWRDAAESEDLFAAPPAHTFSPAPATSARTVRANRAFLDQAHLAILHRDGARLDLLYRILWRLQDEPRLLGDPADPDAGALHRLVRQVRRDIHKMRAFLRFRAMPEDTGPPRYLAWFEPDHRIERANAAFFRDRFASQRWSILTPRLTLHWDGKSLNEAPPARREDVPAHDATEDLWLGYYRSIFNPARLKVGAMVKEMPRRYWKNLPEAAQIPALIAGAQQREAAMIATGAPPADEPAPTTREALADGIAQCRRCPIGCNGTAPVLGEGPLDPPLLILGEQPGDTEERTGRPFVGPAGELLNAHLTRAGIARAQAYVTNAVKHFKFERQGRRLLHQNPTANEIDHCRWWLEAERALVRPRAILALGASAGRALLGRTPSIGRERGCPIPLPDGTPMWLTVHPSYLLRLNGAASTRETERFKADLALVSAHLARENRLHTPA